MNNLTGWNVRRFEEWFYGLRLSMIRSQPNKKRVEQMQWSRRARRSRHRRWCYYVHKWFESRCQSIPIYSFKLRESENILSWSFGRWCARLTGGRSVCPCTLSRRVACAVGFFGRLGHVLSRVGLPADIVGQMQTWDSRSAGSRCANLVTFLVIIRGEWSTTRASYRKNASQVWWIFWNK